MQNVVLERQGGINLDEAYVIDNLKKVIRDKPGSSQAVKALELLGKYQGMWIDKQVIEESSSHADVAREMFERGRAIERGEEVAPLEDKEEQTAEILEFEIQDDKNGTD
jgi:hypothetical protein